VDKLEQILEWAVKASQALNIIAPGVGSIGDVGIGLVKFIVGKWNEMHDDTIELPDDPALIQRLRETSTRVVDDSERFVHEGGGTDPAGPVNPSSATRKGSSARDK
jgi:hypothetical protein